MDSNSNSDMDAAPTVNDNNVHSSSDPSTIYGPLLSSPDANGDKDTMNMNRTNSDLDFFTAQNSSTVISHSQSESTPMLVQPLTTTTGSNETLNDNSKEGYSVDAPTSNFQPRKSLFGTGIFHRRRNVIRILLLTLLLLIILILAIILPIYFKIIKPRNAQIQSAGFSPIPGISSSGQWNPGSPSGDISGGNGSVVIAEDGSRFVYLNQFGGYWVQDAGNPLNNAARPNNWTPPLNTSWTWGQDKIFGVNLGGWLVLEPFITPALFSQYQNLSFPVVDEWSLSLAMSQDPNYPNGTGLFQQLDDHYNTFITEADFAQIAGAGLNWVRLPIPFWAIDVWPGEPFLPSVCWKYALKAFQWARKYGLRIYIDLHTIPGSQNGYNHSGRLGEINFMYGVMGIANAQRALDYIRTITEFISQPEWANMIQVWGIVNEAVVQTIGMDVITDFYLEAITLVRNITGVGENHGAVVSIHDGFIGQAAWFDFLRGADRVAIDTHPYFAFDGGANNQSLETWAPQVCQQWAGSMNDSQQNFGISLAGEFSVGFCDCGLYLKGINATTTYGGDCGYWQDSTLWNGTVKQDLMGFALAEMDALQNWFFWTWKIGNATTGQESVESPLWSYSLGLSGGWIPLDPRISAGTCASYNITPNPFNGTYAPWQTGGPGAGTINPTSLSTVFFPPKTLSGLPGYDTQVPPVGGPVEFLPTYTATGTINTLAPPTFTAAAASGVSVSVSVGDGWFDSADVARGVTSVSGCVYPDAWLAQGEVVIMPTTFCPPGSGPSTATATATVISSSSVSVSVGAGSSGVGAIATATAAPA